MRKAVAIGSLAVTGLIAATSAAFWLGMRSANAQPVAAASSASPAQEVHVPVGKGCKMVKVKGTIAAHKSLYKKLSEATDRDMFLDRNRFACSIYGPTTSCDGIVTVSGIRAHVMTWAPDYMFLNADISLGGNRYMAGVWVSPNDATCDNRDLKSIPWNELTIREQTQTILAGGR